MFGTRALSLIAACFVTDSVLGARIRRAQNSAVASINCDILSKVVVGDRDFGELAARVCRSWPPALGPFPINTTGNLVELIELAFGPSGVFEDMKEIWNTRRSRRFCWRNETLRDIIPEESNFKCKMNVSDVCYGRCPRGYKAGALLGRFQPVCSSVCADTLHQVPCGFGCASTRTACFQSVFSQVSTVAKEVASLMGLIGGDPTVIALIDRILTIADFAVEVVPKILLAIENFYWYKEKGYQNVAFFLLFFQLVAEVYPEGETGNDMEALWAQIGEVMQYILDLTGGDLSNLIDLSVIRDAILNHSDEIMGAIKTITKAFDYPKCGEMQRETAFTIEDAGNEELVGPWVQYYEVDSRPRYALATNSEWTMEYSNFSKNWRVLSPRGWFFRKTMFIANADTSDYPLAGWQRWDGVDPAPLPFPAKFTCNALEQMTVNGHGFGRIAGAICHFWPESLGPFPIQDERRAFDILETAFGKGGLWEQIEGIKSIRRDLPGFCWREEVVREVLPAGINCDLESEGVCYGECPWGFKKSFLIGRFAPVCSSACGESEFTFPCGFGCSSSLGTCLPTVVDQVGEVTRFMGTAASFAFESAAVGEVVERVTYIAEFLLDVMPVLVEAAKQFWQTVREEEAELALLIVLLQYIYETSPENQEEFEVLRENIGETTEFIQSLVHANFQWDEIDLGFIKDRIVAYGDKLLKALVTLTKDFLYRRCEPAESIVEFSVDAAGKNDLMGLWIVNGTHNGRQQYTLRKNDDFRMVWRENSWQFRGPHLGVLRQTLYKSNVDSPTPPTTGWEVKAGELPIPQIIPLSRATFSGQ